MCLLLGEREDEGKKLYKYIFGIFSPLIKSITWAVKGILKRNPFLSFYAGFTECLGQKKL